MCRISLYTFHKHLYKYGWNHSLNNKVMTVWLTVCRRVRSTAQIILLYFQRGVVKCFVYTHFMLALSFLSSSNDLIFSLGMFSKQISAIF